MYILEIYNIMQYNYLVTLNGTSIERLEHYSNNTIR